MQSFIQGSEASRVVPVSPGSSMIIIMLNTSTGKLLDDMIEIRE